MSEFNFRLIFHPNNKLTNEYITENYFDIYHLYEFSDNQNKYNLNMQDIEKVFTQNESMQNDCELDVRII